MLLLQTNVSNLVQDKRTKAIINTDCTAYDAILAERKRAKQESETQQKLENALVRIEILEQQMKSLIDVKSSN